MEPTSTDSAKLEEKVKIPPCTLKTFFFNFYTKIKNVLHITMIPSDKITSDIIVASQKVIDEAKEEKVCVSLTIGY